MEKNGSQFPQILKSDAETNAHGSMLVVVLNVRCF